MTNEKKLQIFNDNVALIYSIVDRHWGKYYVEKDDLIQESMMTFWSALDKYDENRDVSLVSYVYAVVYTHLTTYVQRYRFGSLARSSTFQDAMRAVKHAKTNNVSIDDACDQLKLNQTKRKFAQTIALGDDLCVSLSTPLTTKEPCDTELQDMMADEVDMATEICNNIDIERLRSRLYKNFVNAEVKKFQGKNKRTYRKIAIAYLDTIFVEPRTKRSVAKEIGVSGEMVRKYFDRFRDHLKAYLLKTKLLTEPASCKSS